MSLNLSVGVLYDCQNFIELCDNRSFSLNEVRSAFESRYQAAPIAVVLEMMRAGAWLSFEDDGELKLTARGRQILQCDNPVEALRLQIMDFVVNVKPTWSSLLPKGRSETLQFLTSDARQCFNEAALTDDYDEATIRFWDQIASLSRGRLNDVLLQIGRVGERLSFRYENDRTGRPPTWKSIESNLAGYDILSVVSMNGSEALKIEVKTVKRINERAFYLTKNEWECALGFGQYVFHIWLLGSVGAKAQLLVKQVDEIQEHVAINQGDGQWESLKIDISEWIGQAGVLPEFALPTDGASD